MRKPVWLSRVGRPPPPGFKHNKSLILNALILNPLSFKSLILIHNPKSLILHLVSPCLPQSCQLCLCPAPFTCQPTNVLQEMGEIDDKYKSVSWKRLKEKEKLTCMVCRLPHPTWISFHGIPHITRPAAKRIILIFYHQCWIFTCFGEAPKAPDSSPPSQPMAPSAENPISKEIETNLVVFFTDLVVAVYWSYLQSIWNRGRLWNLNFFVAKTSFYQDMITLLKLSSDSSGGHQDFLKILKMSLSHFCNILRFLSPCIPDLVQLNISLLSHVLRGRRCLEKINVTLKEAPMHWTDPPHHLVEADQLLLRPGHSHLLVGRCRTVESLHEVIRDPARLKRTQACNVWRR